MWQKIKTFFKDSEVRFYAWLTQWGGLVLSVAAIFDFSPLFALGIPTKSQVVGGMLAFAQGMLLKYLRDRRDPEIH